jgi:hypothetical protein
LARFAALPVEVQNERLDRVIQLLKHEIDSPAAFPAVSPTNGHAPVQLQAGWHLQAEFLPLQ